MMMSLLKITPMTRMMIMMRKVTRKAVGIIPVDLLLLLYLVEVGVCILVLTKIKSIVFIVTFPPLE